MLRGAATINGTSPLILIDGVPRDNMDYLSADEVDNVSVLKDASATAVFGVRGANGAILITTKRGQTGQGQARFELRAELDLVHAGTGAPHLARIHRPAESGFEKRP